MFAQPVGGSHGDSDGLSNTQNLDHRCLGQQKCDTLLGLRIEITNDERLG